MKTCCTLLLILLTVGSVLAQEKRTRVFGLKGGANFYNLHATDGEDYKMRVGPQGGVFAQWPLGSQFSIQSELLYSSEGARLVDDADFKIGLRLNYLSVPVLFQYITPSGFYLETGPQFSYRLNFAGVMNDGGDMEREDLTENVKPGAVSWCGGLGYVPKNWGVGIRYNLGLTNIARDLDTPGDKATSRGFALSVIYKFLK